MQWNDEYFLAITVAQYLICGNIWKVNAGMCRRMGIHIELRYVHFMMKRMHIIELQGDEGT